MPHGRYVQYESWWGELHPTAHQPETSAVTLAHVYRFETDGLILGARFFRHQSDAGQHRAWLQLPGNFQPISIGAFKDKAADGVDDDGWQHCYFNKLHRVAAGESVIVAVHFSDGSFYYTAGLVLIDDVTHGNITAVHDTDAHHNGQFTYNANLRLNDTFGATLYGIDVLFQPRAY